MHRKHLMVLAVAVFVLTLLFASASLTRAQDSSPPTSNTMVKQWPSRPKTSTAPTSLLVRRPKGN
jgi:hypothetical protein